MHGIYGLDGEEIPGNFWTEAQARTWQCIGPGSRRDQGLPLGASRMRRLCVTTGAADLVTYLEEGAGQSSARRGRFFPLLSGHRRPIDEQDIVAFPGGGGALGGGRRYPATDAPSRPCRC